MPFLRLSGVNFVHGSVMGGGCLLGLRRWVVGVVGVSEVRGGGGGCGGVGGRGHGLAEAERRSDLGFFALVKLVEIETEREKLEIVIRMRIEHEKEFVHHVLISLVDDHQLRLERGHLTEEEGKKRKIETNGGSRKYDPKSLLEGHKAKALQTWTHGRIRPFIESLRSE